MVYRLFVLLGFILSLGAFWAEAWAVELGLPVSCRYGKDCFIQNYVDHHGADGRFYDYQCGSLSYDGHKGTDFRLRDYVAMRHGVDVIAAADGVVKGVRDGMDDVNVYVIGEDQVEGRECGNGVLISHIGGYETQYCHLKGGTVKVKEGDAVSKGQVLGQVGMSGLAAFPHVELSVRKDGETIDPFIGDVTLSHTYPLPCPFTPIKGSGLWDKEASKKLTYRSTALLNAWFTSGEPSSEEARAGRFMEPSIARDAEMIVFWIDAMGLKLRDDLKLVIYDPDGEVLVDDHEVVGRDKALYFRYLGKKSKNHFWKEGKYTGEVTLLRDRKPIFHQIKELEVR